MATGWFFRSSYRAWRSLKYLSARSLNQSSAHHSLLQPLTQQIGLHKLGTMGVYESCGSAYMLPIIVSSLLGFGVIDTASADSNQATDKPQLPSEQPPSCFADLAEAAKKERRRLEDLLRSRGLLYGTYPHFTVAIKGQKITIKFQVPPVCEVPRLIANLVSTLGLKVEDRPELLVRASDSAVAWQITLSRREHEKVEEMVHDADAIPEEPELVVSIFRSLIGADKAEVEFIKRGSFTEGELDALASLLQIAGERPRGKQESKQVGQHGEPSSMNKSIASLESMGVRVFGLDEPCMSQRSNQISWDTIAGYEKQKREIEDTILLALQSPEIYDDIARGTRRKFESNRPRAVLFEGPPGTGKTSCARVIANQAGVPLLYVPLEVVMSKYYGESERLLGKVFTLADELPNGAIIFLDEVDSFAVARDTEIHEATRRILSVLLRQIDGFEQEKKVVVVAATNRKQDLDPALISRFDSMITFGLPDLQNRQEIAAQFAKHLAKNDLSEFASATDGMSGRDIRDVCLQAERRWASKIIRGQTTGVVKEDSLPPLSEYIECAAERSKILHAVEKQRYQDFNMRRDRRPLDMS